jgi:hypothetical protein
VNPDSAKKIALQTIFSHFPAKLFLRIEIFTPKIPFKLLYFGGLGEKIHNECNFFLPQ